MESLGWHNKAGNSREAQETSVGNLKKNRRDMLYSRLSAEDTAEVFEKIEQIYADLDGTCLEAGTTQFSPEMLQYLRLLQEHGVFVTFVTGKPFGEVDRLLVDNPDVDLDIIYEKGAFRTVSRDGGFDDMYMLGTDDMETAVNELRDHFFAVKGEIEQVFQVELILSGSGVHQMVLSLDVVRPDYKEYPDVSRRDIKVYEPEKLKGIKSWIEAWLQRSYGDKFVLTDLGNANFEIAEPFLNKTAAIEHVHRERAPRGQVLMVGDSGNDEEMFALDFGWTCLVRHDQTPERLNDMTDFVIEGEGSAASLFKKIAVAKGLTNGNNIIATNTGPYRRKNGSLELCEGMPVVFADLMRKSERSAWIYVGNDAFDDVEHELSGKIQAVPVSPQERKAHYANISNQVLWPVAHKPEAGVKVHEFSEEDWMTYERVCSRVATNVNIKLEKNHLENPHIQTTLWIQDYQMLPVAEKLRELRPQEDYNLGLYWHIPFPRVAVMIEELGEEKAARIVRWLSNYHMVGFHISAYAENYLEACQRFRLVPAQVLVQPISVNVDEITGMVEEISREGHRFEQEELNDIFEVENLKNGVRREVDIVLCGMERCDDTKACIERLEAWKMLAEKSPEIFSRRKIVEVIVPSRQEIPAYRERYQHALTLIDEINTMLEQKIGRRPVRHVERILQRKDVMAAMALSNAVMVTPNKDGFNMVGAEACVVQMASGVGHTLVSDQVGFYRSLQEHGLEPAIDVIETESEKGIAPEVIADAIERFLAEKIDQEMSTDRLEAMREFFRMYTLGKWVTANLQGIKYSGLLRDIQQISS